MGIDTTLEELGGARKHVEESGMGDLLVADEETCIDKIKEFLSYLPNNCNESPPQRPTRDDPERLCSELRDIVPTDLRFAYDIKKIIHGLVDDGKFFEFKPSLCSKLLVTCMGSIWTGRVVGFNPAK